MAYIDFNPIEARLVDRPQDYPHGSAYHYARPSGPSWLCRSWVESAVQDVSRADLYRPASYPDVFGAATNELGRSLVARRLARSSTRNDPLDDLVAAAPPAVLDWMHRKARLGDGTRSGLPVCAVESLRATILKRRASRTWLLFARGQEFDAWNQIETGLLRELCGLTLRELSSSTGRGESTMGRLCERHRDRLASDATYAAEAAEIACESLRNASSVGSHAALNVASVSRPNRVEPDSRREAATQP